AFCHGDAPPLQPLQCGHGSKAVEIGDIPQVKTLGDIVLQCGHGSKAVEIITQNPLSSVRSPCFNAATAPRPWRSPPPLRPVAFMTGFNAATAPRPWRSGDFAVPSDWSDTLQCGHGSKAVEITVQRKLLSSAVQLQCGHGSKAVEIAISGIGGDHRIPRFNAATAPRPWRSCRRWSRGG